MADSDANAILKKLLEAPKSGAGVAGGDQRERIGLAQLTPEQQRQMQAAAAVPHAAVPHSAAPVPHAVLPHAASQMADPYPWMPHLNIPPDVWMKIPVKERQHIYGVPTLCCSLLSICL